MKKISIAILTLLVVMSACKKVPEVNLKYVDVERDLITVGTTTATVQCDYQYIATLKKAYLYYGEGENETNMNTAEMRVVQNTLYVDLTGLKGSTTYSYYYEFHNDFNSMRTALKSFKTEAGNSGGEEPPTPPEIMLPTVVTALVTEITTNSAQCGGEVVNDGGAEVTERGICWSTNANPTLSDNHVAAGTGIGAFTAAMDGLETNTTYYVCAYATNEAGTAYGLDREFVTISDGSGTPEGAIDGLFSVSPTKKVYFSQGNLQYQASTNTWRFAENQWDYVGGTYMNQEYGTVYNNNIKCDNSLISSSYSGWIDLFGWGTSGYHNNSDSSNVYYQPWCAHSGLTLFEYNSTGYGPSANMPSPDLTGLSSNYDWGVYNSISNGGNQTNLWRTLTKEEWEYVILNRNTTSGFRFVKGVVGPVQGLILFPDDWDTSFCVFDEVNQADATYDYNIFDATTWSIMEQNGAVFLPITGYRYSYPPVFYNFDFGYYFTATHSGWSGCYTICFNGAFIEEGEPRRDTAHSVRLVQDANP